MPFRDDLAAAQARVEVLAQENAKLRDQNSALQVRGPAPLAQLAVRRDRLVGRLALSGAALMTSALISIAVASGAGITLSLMAVGCWALGMAGLGRTLGAVAGPGEILVVSGRARMAADGSQVGYRLFCFGERVWRAPLIEQIDRLDVRPHTVDVLVSAAYTKEPQAVELRAQAIVRIDASEPGIHHAVERFLGGAIEDVHTIARGIISAEFRASVARMSGTDVRRDQKQLVGRVQERVNETLQDLGICVDAIVIVDLSGLGLEARS